MLGLHKLRFLHVNKICNVFTQFHKFAFFTQVPDLLSLHKCHKLHDFGKGYVDACHARDSKDLPSGTGIKRRSEGTGQRASIYRERGSAGVLALSVLQSTIHVSTRRTFSMLRKRSSFSVHAEPSHVGSRLVVWLRLEFNQKH